MRLHVEPRRVTGQRDDKIFGHFIEHFHRQIYGGVYDPGNSLSGADGLREDVLEAMRKIKTPVLRWPGGCFVSAYNWKDGVGKDRQPSFDKAWRVEEPNTFGTDEYMRLCEKLNCEPYICTNAGTGTAEEMSDWVEYCNLKTEGRWAKARIANGREKPYGIKYWSIGNENYGAWEIGAKRAEEWAELVCESAKMMRRVDPTIELSAAALDDLDWNLALLKRAGQYLSWISIHGYWDALHQVNDYAGYEAAMAMTAGIGDKVDRVRGLLAATGYTGKIKVAFDEWNLRGWHHPNTHTIRQGLTPEEYLAPRDLNDDNTRYTMADAVFSACFLNMCLRNCDLIGMANFAPVVNTRGCIFTHENGIVLRSAYHVFDLYVNYTGEKVLDTWLEQPEPGPESIAFKDKQKQIVSLPALDAAATLRSDGTVAVAAVNRHAEESRDLELIFGGSYTPKQYRVCTVNGESTEAYNGIGREGVKLSEGEWRPFTGRILLEPHSVNVVQIN